MTKFKNVSIVLVTLIGMSFFSACSNDEDKTSSAVKSANPLTGHWTEEKDPKFVVTITEKGEVVYSVTEGHTSEIAKNGVSRGTLAKVKQEKNSKDKNEVYTITVKDKAAKTKSLYTFTLVDKDTMSVVIRTMEDDGHDHDHGGGEKEEMTLVRKSIVEVNGLIAKAIKLKQDQAAQVKLEKLVTGTYHGSITTGDTKEMIMLNITLNDGTVTGSITSHQEDGHGSLGTVTAVYNDKDGHFTSLNINITQHGNGLQCMGMYTSVNTMLKKKVITGALMNKNCPSPTTTINVKKVSDEPGHGGVHDDDGDGGHEH